MDIVELVRRRKGVARTSTLYDSGASQYALRQAVDRGRLIRVRRGWVATNDADQALVAAARRGVVLTCVTQAARLGLWSLGQSHDHVGATPGSAGGKLGRVHWSKPVIPRDPDILEDPIENVLAIVATCQPFEEALAIWDSALRHDLVDLESLRRLPWRARERRLLAEADPFADVGLETYLRIRLKRLRLPIRCQTWIAGHCVDALVGDRLVIQIDGGHHVGAQRNQDNRHDAELKLRGYHVIRIGYHQLVHDWPAVQDLILRAVAQRLHLAR